MTEAAIALNDIILELVALGVYTLFIFFTFCDGFKLHVAKKLILALFFLAVCTITFRAFNEFDLKSIIASSSFIAFTICWLDKKFKKKKD